MTKYIVIDSMIYPIDTDSEIEIAECALWDAGLSSEDVWVSPGNSSHADAAKNGQKLFAKNPNKPENLPANCRMVDDGEGGTMVREFASNEDARMWDRQV